MNDQERAAKEPIWLDSEKGIQMLADFARKGGFVLNQYHADIAKKYGVSFDGVIVAGQLK